MQVEHSKYWNDVALKRMGGVMRGYEAAGCYLQTFDAGTGARSFAHLARCRPSAPPLATSSTTIVFFAPRRGSSPMTKSDLIEQVARKLQLSTSKAELVVDGIFEAMEESLGRGDRIEVRGFGSFEIRHYDGYAGRNPRTGDPVEVRPKRLPFFKASKEMKERLGRGERRRAAAGRKSAAG